MRGGKGGEGREGREGKPLQSAGGEGVRSRRRASGQRCRQPRGASTPCLPCYPPPGLGLRMPSLGFQHQQGLVFPHCHTAPAGFEFVQRGTCAHLLSLPHSLTPSLPHPLTVTRPLSLARIAVPCMLATHALPPRLQRARWRLPNKSMPTSLSSMSSLCQDCLAALRPCHCPCLRMRQPAATARAASHPQQGRGGDNGGDVTWGSCFRGGSPMG